MNKTATYVIQYGNKILTRGYYENGSRFDLKEDFTPTLFTYSSKSKESEWKDLYGNFVFPVQPGTIKECKEFISQYNDVEGFKILEPPSYTSQYMIETYPSDIIPNIDHMKIFIVDIETALDGNSFPSPQYAAERITLISIFDSTIKKIIVFSSKKATIDSKLLSDNNIDINDVILRVFEDEKELLFAFVNYWSTIHPDIVTGWNSKVFDLPYVIKRMEIIGLESQIKRLSPWGLVWDKSSMYNGKLETKYDIIGVSQLDYMELMKKYTYGGRESWKLDNIAFEELGRKKLEHEGTFKEFYENNWDRFVAYNIIDVQLVKDLDAKLNLIDLIMTVASEVKSNPSDVMSPIKTWDNLIYNYLNKKKIMIPARKNNHGESYEGAYVKDPMVGKHKWVVSFDLASLYPHIIMQYNMSTETIQNEQKLTSVDDLLNEFIDLSDLKENNLTMAANGSIYRRDQHGFIPEMMEYFYTKRKSVKKKMLGYEQDYQDTKDKSLVAKISSLHNTQMAIKILINSLYGALASPYFRYYDLRIAEGITLSGQLAIKWIGKELDVVLNKINKTNDFNYLVYGDTDSIYLTLEKLVEDHYAHLTDEEIVKKLDDVCEKIIQPAIDKSYQKLADYLNAYEQKMIMKREVIASVGLFVKKKKYALLVHNNEGVQYATPKLKVTGLELVRSSTPAIIKDSLRDSLKIVLLEDENATQSFIAKVRDTYNNYSVEEISFPRGVNGLSKNSGSPIYAKGCPMHVRASLLYNHYLKKFKLTGKYESIGEGAKMKFVFLKMPNPFHENIIGFLDKLPIEFGLHEYIDYDMQFQKSFIDAMNSVMEPIGWQPEAQSSLADFFG